jgi:hypothetical protein
MNLLADNSGHHWISFALGVVAGIVTILIVKSLRRRREGR